MLMHVEYVSPESKMRQPDRILELSLIDPEKKNELGMVDPRLLDPTKNQIHIKMDMQTSLWSIHYEKGAVPQPLLGSYTSFSKAKEQCERYLANRNIKIVKIRD